MCLATTHPARTSFDRPIADTPFVAEFETTNPPNLIGISYGTIEWNLLPTLVSLGLDAEEAGRRILEGHNTQAES